MMQESSGPPGETRPRTSRHPHRAHSGYVQTKTNRDHEPGHRDHVSDARFLIGAGDGNRTRTISLGICPAIFGRQHSKPSHLITQ